MARLRIDSGTLETRIFIAFNHNNDEAARRCPGHLTSMFEMLRKVPNKSVNGTRKIISDDLTDEFIKICTAIHTYSFDIFAYRVTNRSARLSQIQDYIKNDQSYFLPEQRTTLQMFLSQVGLIIKIVKKAEATKQVAASSMEFLRSTYLCWTLPKYNILPNDGLAGNNLTLLDMADKWLFDGA